MKYNVYMAGYQEMDSAYAPSHLAGTVEAPSFKEACAILFSSDEHKRFYRKEECRYWALRLGSSMYSVCDDYPLEQWLRDIDT